MREEMLISNGQEFADTRQRSISRAGQKQIVESWKKRQERRARLGLERETTPPLVLKIMAQEIGCA